MESMVLVGCRVLRPTVSRPTADESQRERLGASPSIRAANSRMRKGRAWLVRAGRVDASRRAAGSNSVSFRVFRRGERRRRGSGPGEMRLMATLRDAGVGGAKVCTEKWAALAAGSRPVCLSAAAASSAECGCGRSDQFGVALWQSLGIGSLWQSLALPRRPAKPAPATPARQSRVLSSLQCSSVPPTHSCWQGFVLLCVSASPLRLQLCGAARGCVSLATSSKVTVPNRVGTVPLLCT